MAAPAVTGLVALIYAEAAGKGVDLPVANLRTRVMTTALSNPPAGVPANWDPRYGFGRADSGAIA